MHWAGDLQRTWRRICQKILQGSWYGTCPGILQRPVASFRKVGTRRIEERFILTGASGTATAGCNCGKVLQDVGMSRKL